MCGFSTSTDEPNADLHRNFDSYLNPSFLIGYPKEAIMLADFPVVFWGEKGQQYALLCLMTQEYISIPAVSVPSEQIFSPAGWVLPD